MNTGLWNMGPRLRGDDNGEGVALTLARISDAATDGT